MKMVQSNSRFLRFFLGILIVALMLALHPASPAYAASFTVTSTGDQPDGDTTDGLCRVARTNECTLRAAIQQANALPGHDTITFKLGTATISPATALPDLTDDKGVTIQGNRDITLNGSRAGHIGLRILNSRKNKIQGLIIRDFTYGVVIAGGLFNVASFNTVGTDGDGVNDTADRNVIRNNTLASSSLVLAPTTIPSPGTTSAPTLAAVAPPATAPVSGSATWQAIRGSAPMAMASTMLPKAMSSAATTLESWSRRPER
jgi:CSLREA domain-containing protein